jgi:serine/threonine protein kinase
MKIKRVVGEGSYGQVVICEKNDREFAMKTVKGDYYGLVSLQELDIMNGISNPFIVSALKTYIETNSTILFMDVADETLHRHRIKDDQEMRTIAFQMITGLAFLEKMSIIHGDIKANNYLCFRDKCGIPLNVRLTDFSLSCRAYGIPPLFKMYCSVYRPIECWYSEAECKSDVWALGCCIYELMTKESQLFPSQDENYDSQYVDRLVELINDRTVVHERWRPSYDVYVRVLGQFAEQTGQPLSRSLLKRISDSSKRVDHFPKELNVFVRDWRRVYDPLPHYLKRMLTVDPSERPSALELFHSPEFEVERGILAGQLRAHYASTDIAYSNSDLILLDGVVKQHVGRIPLEYAEVLFFLLKPLSRITLISALDMYSKCKHYEEEDDVKYTCLFISTKLTDPNRIDYVESMYAPRPISRLVNRETTVCRLLNFVLYPEDRKIFTLTDDQLVAFYV